jgi:subtilisin family serine protease
MRLSIWIVCLAICVGAIFTFNLFSPHEETNSNRYKSTAGQAVELALISPGKPPAKDHSGLHKEINSDFSFWDDKSLKGLSDILLTARDPDYWLDAGDLSMNGFEITDRLDHLGIMRIRVHDPDAFARFLRDNADDFELQKNIRLKIPTVPEQRILEMEKSFAGTSMDWLGTKEDRWNSGTGIKVAVLDTGIDGNHESLSGLNFSEVSLVGENSKSGMGHGTGIASIIAGQTEGFLGLAPASEILSVKVLGKDGEGDSFTIAKGIMLAVDRGADIINLSLGGGSSSVAIDNAIQYAKSRDVLLVSAVGNDGLNEVAYPARHQDVIAVSSVDANSRVSTFANFGPEVDLAAPGVGVFTAWENSGFVEFSGTSISAAFVTGALAHELSRSPLQNKKDAIDALYANVDETEKPGKDIWAGRGVINMRRLDQRNTPGIVDAAVVGYYFDPSNLLSSGTTPFQVTVQNQGTTWIQSMNLKVKYKGLEKDFRLGNLSSGEIRSETLYFDSGTPSKELSISSELNVFGKADKYPENNVRKSRLVLP